jgi:serine/threonine protein kinase
MGLGPLRDDDPAAIGGYPLLRRLGAGGMGVVYLAEAPHGLVAIKRLRREYTDDNAFRERFRREADALTRVDGAFTARVLAVAVETADPYLVLEYVDGPSLAARVDQDGPLPADLVRALGAGLAAALLAIHGAGIVHRDLKPANVLLSTRGPKVIDFGIAHIADATSLTNTGTTLGTPVFMAPEQITGRSGPPVDVFTLALTVAYAATGRPPFGTGTAPAVMYRIAHAEPDLAGVPDDIKPVLTAALAKDPERRPTPRELIAAFTDKPVAEHPDDAVTTLMADTWPEARTARRTKVLAPLPESADRKRVPGAALVLSWLAAALVVGVLVAIGAHRNQNPDPPHDTSTSTTTPQQTTATPTTYVSCLPPATECQWNPRGR